MRHDGARNRDKWDRAARRSPRRFSLLLGALVAIWLTACGGRDIVFVGDPLAGDPRIALITLDVCECDSCQVTIDDPESGQQVLKTNPPLLLSVVADACYDKAMIRIRVECGGCPLAGPCTATATLALDDGSGSPIDRIPSPTCVALPGPATFCSAAETFDISMSPLVNPACPM